MAEFDIVLEKDEIKRMVAAVATRISDEYKNHELVLIGVLKGAFIFLSDIVRELTIPFKVDFVSVSSYGSDSFSSGNVKLKKEIEIDVSRKDLLIIEDIVDTGQTLSFLIDYLRSFNPKSIKVCTMLDKHDRRKATVTVDYACHVVGRGFFVGYGLDYAENYRNLPEIYNMKL